MTERRRVQIDGKAPNREASVAPETVVDCACPRLDAEDWHDVESDWSDIAFVRSSTNAVLGVPVGYDTARRELREKAAKLGASVPEDALLLLGSGRFRRPIMLEVENAPAAAKGIERPRGIAFTRLVDAPWGAMQKTVDEARDLARERYGRNPDHLWVWYLTCRQCSRERNFETLVVAHYRVPA